MKKLLIDQVVFAPLLTAILLSVFGFSQNMDKVQVKEKLRAVSYHYRNCNPVHHCVSGILYPYGWFLQALAGCTIGKFLFRSSQVQSELYQHCVPRLELLCGICCKQTC